MKTLVLRRREQRFNLSVIIITATAILLLQCSSGVAEFVDATGMLHQPFEDEDLLSLSLLANNVTPELIQRERLRVVDGRFSPPLVRDGVPEGVECDEVLRCDSSNVCARVCARGTLQIDPWLSFTVDYQWRLSRLQPLCLSQLLGSHNSGITLADGYGAHDDIYTVYLRALGLATGSQRLTTNNQLLSLT
ncbi:hypothetical protein Agub_g10475, partial [Astrephomene gubernaculifera]